MGLDSLLKEGEQFMLFPLLISKGHALKFLRKNPGSAITDSGSPTITGVSNSKGRIPASIVYDVRNDIYILVGGDIKDTLEKLDDIGFVIEHKYGQPIVGPVELNQRLGYQ